MFSDNKGDNKGDNISDNKGETNITEILDYLDKKGYESLKKVLHDNPDGANLLGKAISSEGGGAKTPDEMEAMDRLQNGLMSIMQNGSKEFEKKTGRRMTYAEMRYAYG